MAHFYAFEHHYDQNIRDERGTRIGRVVVFDHKRDRDAYCYEEDAEPICAPVARRQLLDEIQALDLNVWGAAVLKSVGTIDEIIARRDSLLAQWNELCYIHEKHMQTQG